MYQEYVCIQCAKALVRWATGKRFRSHAGHFFMRVFADYYLLFFYFEVFFLFLNRSYIISSIFILAVGDMPYGKRHTPEPKLRFDCSLS